MLRLTLFNRLTRDFTRRLASTYDQSPPPNDDKLSTIRAGQVTTRPLRHRIADDESSSERTKRYDEQWSTPWNVNIMPEEVRYAEPQFDSETERQRHDGVLQRVNERMLSNNNDRLFAIIHLSGSQYRASPGDLIAVGGTYHVALGERIRLGKVLAVGSTDFTLVGRPILDRDLVRVEATCVEKTLEAAQVMLRHVKKIRYKNYVFQRRPLTVLRINEIAFERALNEPRRADFDLQPSARQGDPTFESSGAGEDLSGLELPDFDLTPIKKLKNRKVP